MRFINLEELRPRIRELIPALRVAHEAVMGEMDPDRRAALIHRFQNRWVAFRRPFEEFSHGKCWYLECRNPGTDEDVDHFRPKLGVAEAPEHPGYYWLAFDWTNLRLSCHRANRLRINPETEEVGGKGGHFPLLNEAERAQGPGDDLTQEQPALLDPTNPADPPLLSFRANGEVDLSPEFKDNASAQAKFEASRFCLHLNWPQFRDARVILYNCIERLVDRGEREAPVAYDVCMVSAAFADVIRDLVTVMDGRAEYSAAARLYVESFKHVWWVRDIVLRVRP
jgi:uncharacterized protein (TIGR02646 family)